MMALVGKNGTGKTRVLAALAHVLSGLGPEKEEIRTVEQRRRVVTISFSAFDRFVRPDSTDWSYSYYGLRRPVTKGTHGGRTDQQRQHPEVLDLKYAFFRLDRSLREIGRRGDAEKQRWREMIDRTGFFR